MPEPSVGDGTVSPEPSGGDGTVSPEPGEARRLQDDEVRRIAERLDALLEALATRAEPELVAAVAEIADGLQRVHAEGLRRLVGILAEDSERLGRALDDPVVSNLLLLYDLVVVDEARRAREAVEAILPLARSHGGEIELVGAEAGVVRVRLHGACHGCPSSSATLRQGIERALADRVPGFVRLEVEEAAGTAPPATAAAAGPSSGPDGHLEVGSDGYASFVPEENVRRLARRASEEKPETRVPRRRLSVAPLDEVPRGALFGRLVEGFPVLLVRAAPGLRAYRNQCPGSFLPLHLGGLEDDEIRCPWHGCRFDAATGACRGAPGTSLEALHSGIEEGRVWVEASV